MEAHNLFTADANFVGGEGNNVVAWGKRNFIYGHNNSIDSASSWNLIFGEDNRIFRGGNNSILGGYNNYLGAANSSQNGANQGVIIGGFANRVSGNANLVYGIGIEIPPKSQGVVDRNSNVAIGTARPNNGNSVPNH